MAPDRPARAAWLLLLLSLLAAARRCSADFRYAAGNWTTQTNLFSELHFVPGYNQDGEWEVLTGGNWTPTNHSDANMVGSASAYICPCPLPPCEPVELPPPAAFKSTVFPCVGAATMNVSYAVCTVFHSNASTTNVTCVTPKHAVICDIPSYDANASLANWWENEAAPSASYYSYEPSMTTAISCIVRGMSEQPMDRYGNFSEPRLLEESAQRLQRHRRAPP